MWHRNHSIEPDYGTREVLARKLNEIFVLVLQRVGWVLQVWHVLAKQRAEESVWERLAQLAGEEDGEEAQEGAQEEETEHEGRGPDDSERRGELGLGHGAQLVVQPGSYVDADTDWDYHCCIAPEN